MLAGDPARHLHPATDGLERGHPATAALLALFTLAIFLSTAATNVLAGVVCGTSLFYWYRFRPLWLLRHPVSIAVASFYAWLLLRELPDGGLEGIAHAADQFRILAFVVLWLPLFVAARHRRAVLAAAGGSILLFMVMALVGRVILGHLFYPTMIHKLTFELPAGIHQFVLHFFMRAPDFAGPILVGFTFAAFELAWLDRRRRWCYLAFGIAATAVVFLATARRTSQVGWVLCGLLYLLLHLKLLPLRQRLVLAAVTIATVVGLLATPTMQDSFGRIVSDVKEFNALPASERGNVQTSGTLRLRFWTVALGVVEQSPWTGTSESAYRRHYVAQDNAMGGSSQQQQHGHPHNEYLHVLGALGIVGLALYVALHVAAMRSGKAQPSRAQRHILGYYLLAALSSAFVNSLAIDMVPGHFHALALLGLAFFPWDAPPEAAA